LQIGKLQKKNKQNYVSFTFVSEGTAFGGPETFSVSVCSRLFPVVESATRLKKNVKKLFSNPKTLLIILQLHDWRKNHYLEYKTKAESLQGRAQPETGL